MLMKKKSYNSLSAAQELINKKGIYCTQSVHCSYYAVLQMMKYILAHVKVRPIPYDKQDSKDGKSHEKLLMEIKNRINDSKKERNFSGGSPRKGGEPPENAHPDVFLHRRIR